MSEYGAAEGSTSFSQCSIQAMQEKIEKIIAEDKTKDVKCLMNLPMTENSYDDLIISQITFAVDNPKVIDKTPAPPSITK